MLDSSREEAETQRQDLQQRLEAEVAEVRWRRKHLLYNQVRFHHCSSWCTSQ